MVLETLFLLLQHQDEEFWGVDGVFFFGLVLCNAWVNLKKTQDFNIIKTDLFLYNTYGDEYRKPME